MAEHGLNLPQKLVAPHAVMSVASLTEESADGILAAETSLPEAGRTHEAVKA